MRARIVLLAVVAVLGGSLQAASAASAGCSTVAKPGEWRSYGHDLSNTRTQPDEKVLSTSTVGNVAMKFAFHAPDAVTNGGAFSNTPVVADGCLFLASNTGWVFALNADDGSVVWHTKWNGSSQTLLGGVIVGSPLVENGVVFVGVSRPGTPYVAAMDEFTGDPLWTATVESGQQNALINASPIYYDGMVFMGFAGNEGGSVSRGGFAILDAGHDCGASDDNLTCFNPVAGATGGTRLAHTYTITDQEYAAGYRGASEWCTGVVDTTTGYAYACGGNPSSKRIESRYSDALLKIDMRRGSATFGQIVDAFKGNPEQYVPGVSRQPVCDNFGDQLNAVWSVGCQQLDLDFGASPNLYTDSMGRTMVSDLQKAGVVHTVYGDNMEEAWSTIVAPPCFSCNASSGAYDVDPVTHQVRLFVLGSPPSQMVSLSSVDGRYTWATPVGDGLHFESVSTANGVVYVMDGYGTLHGYDASTGLPVLAKSLSADAGTPVTDASGSTGISIARNTIYAAEGEWVIAYA